MIDHNDYIEIVPGKRGGKPCIKGNRIIVSDVLNWTENGMSIEQIIYDFPELSKEQIQACLAYPPDR